MLGLKALQKFNIGFKFAKLGKEQDSRLCEQLSLNARKNLIELHIDKLHDFSSYTSFQKLLFYYFEKFLPITDFIKKKKTEFSPISVRFLFDTGFDHGIQIPRYIADLLDLHPCGDSVNYQIADGKIISVPLYDSVIVCVKKFNNKNEIEKNCTITQPIVQDHDDMSLLGRRQMKDLKIALNFSNSQEINWFVVPNQKWIQTNNNE